MEGESTSQIKKDNLTLKTKEWLLAIKDKNVHKWPFDMDHAALLVIDMQKYFLNEKAKAFMESGVSIIENVNKLISHFQKAGRPVICTRHAHKKDGTDLGILGKWWKEMPLDGTTDADIDERIKNNANDILITKHRYSAFYKTNLDEVLQKKNVSEVVVTGVMTNLCCESTARDAFFRDYMVRFVADATASNSERMHVSALSNLAYAFADVCTTDELIGVK